VLRGVEADVCARAPERGGALLGPPGRALVTRWLADDEAATTSASYRPSRALDARVKEAERGEGLELKGVLHSHPRGLDHPSEQDARELAVGLRVNGHLASYLAPIVTSPREPGAQLEAHEVALGAGKVSFFAAHRAREGGAVVRPVAVRVVPLQGDLERVATLLGGAVEAFVSDAGAGPMLTGRVHLDGGVELLVLASELYPALPPALLVTAEGATDQLDARWRLDAPAEERLVLAVREGFSPPGPYRRGYGPAGGPALTRDAERAALAGWRPRFAADPDGAAARARDALFARSEGLLPRALAGRSALVAGCGSVGSYLAAGLARAGVGALALVDPEPVEAANLSRTVYDVEDVGRPKVDALARHLLAASPALRLDRRASPVEALAPADLDALVRGADVVVAATDDPAAQRLLNRFAYARGRPALFVGLYAGAHGGEVVVSVPERTPCYLCATRARHDAERAAGRVAREVDYGSGRLAGEVALAADIQHVASAALKLALSLLLPRGAGGALEAFAAGAIEDGMPYLTMSTVPRYWFYPQVFGDVPGQQAYQSVWLTPARAAACPICGDAAAREEPLDAATRAPSATAIAAARARAAVTPGSPAPSPGDPADP
jgi:proteasome lid subunit RPN8/RPN11